MACSLPVLIPASGGIQEAVTDGETGLLYPALDHEALGTLMIKIQRDKELASRLGAAARVVVEEDFSVRNYTRRLLDLYAGSERMGRRSA